MAEADRPRPPGFWHRPWLWPVRWRLTAVSATLTFLILITFAVVVGNLATSRIRGDFDEEVTGTGDRLAFDLQIHGNTISPDPASKILAGSSSVRVVPSDGTILPGHATHGAPPLPPPAVTGTGLTTSGQYRIQTVRIPSAEGVIGLPTMYVQYARSTSSVDATINKLWLFLFAGVLGGTLLATLAGLAVARRAMSPIATLTAAAREIAATRDPSRKIPKPETDDEVAELAATLDDMLRALDAARTETEQMIQAQREFVADASHELRTPLTSILANLELLQTRLDAGERDGEEGEMIDGALRSSRRMGRLVSDLLILARADAGRTGARRECDLAQIAAAALSEVRPVAAGHRLELSAPQPVPVIGNPDELHRLALNLLENALRHTPPGTEIELSIGRRNGHAVLEVADDGPGIPAGMEEQIFGRFVRGSGPADVSSNGGTGLGLAIVEAVASSHGGAVTAGASRSGGARFTVTFPLRGGRSAPAPPSPPRRPAKV
jgi:signal transduction histidine kinase